MSDQLSGKYRPKTFEAVIGQGEAAASVKQSLDSGTSQAFIFHGPSGTGKTTLARIVASYLGCEPQNVIEIDAASNSGIDAMREITETLSFVPMGKKNNKRVIIIDEAHGLSTQAWQSLLKSVEEPPKGTYWIFCTTHFSKIPKMIMTRCLDYQLKEVDEKLLFKLLSEVAESECFELDEEIIDFIAENSDGSPRQALVNLAKCSSVNSRKEAAGLLVKPENDGDIIEICRMLSKPGASIVKVQTKVRSIENFNSESARIVIFAYFSKVALGAKSDDAIGWALSVLDAFREPYPPSAPVGYFLLSLGELLLAE